MASNCAINFLNNSQKLSMNVIAYKYNYNIHYKKGDNEHILVTSGKHDFLTRKCVCQRHVWPRPDRTHNLSALYCPLAASAYMKRSWIIEFHSKLIPRLVFFQITGALFTIQ